MLAELLRPKRTNVRWTDEDWDDLAQRVWKKRARQPDESLMALCNAVQEQPDWPADRKRKIGTVAQIQPLVERLRKIDLDFVEMRDRYIPSLRDSLETFRSRPDKDQILQALCAEEICRRFTKTVFEHCSPAEIIQRFTADELLSAIPVADIFAYVGQAIFGDLSALQLRLAEHLLEHQKAPATNGHARAAKPVHQSGKPKIAVIGLQQHQLPVLLSHVGSVCEIVYVPKASSKDQCASIAAEHAVLWETYTTGVQKNAVKAQFSGDHLTVHRGTLNQLIQRMEALPICGRPRKPK